MYGEVGATAIRRTTVAEGGGEGSPWWFLLFVFYLSCFWNGRVGEKTSRKGRGASSTLEESSVVVNRPFHLRGEEGSDGRTRWWMPT